MKKKPPPRTIIGTSFIRHSPPAKDHHRALGIVLLQEGDDSHEEGAPVPRFQISDFGSA